MKKCSVCKIEKSLENFNKDNSKALGVASHCRVCNIQKQRIFRKHNKEILNLQARKCNKKLKLDILEYYGKKCRCGEKRFECLSIDHINGGGNAHRRSLGNKGGAEFYRWIRQNNYPKEFQILCMNCQFVKRAKEYNYGYKEQ